MRLRELIETIVAMADVRHVDVHECVLNDAVRHQLYLTAFGALGPERDRELIHLVRMDPDTSLVAATVGRFIDQRARTAANRRDFDTWVDGLAVSLPQHGFCAKRVAEWRLYKDIGDGTAVDPEQVVEASDWLQRQLVTDRPGPAHQPVLAALADRGRTKRVRKTAGQALAELPE